MMTQMQQLGKFFDDAAIFPPGLAPLPRAVEEHLARLSTPLDQLVGPFIAPITDVPEVARVAGARDISVAAIVPLSQKVLLFDAQTHYLHVHIVAAEIKVDVDGDWIAEVEKIARKDASISIFVELPARLVTPDNLARLHTLGAGLKFRTGGITQELFPTPEDLIGVLSLCIEIGLPFKLTAGLHRAMRYTDPNTGFAHFGFLNIAAAVEALKQGKSRDEALTILNSDDAELVKATVNQSSAWRESFRSFGTCSIAEPLDTLQEINF